MNLLPIEEKEFLKKGFKMRFVVLSNFLISASFLAGIILLIPSYFMADEHFKLLSDMESMQIDKDEALINEALKLPEEINSKLKFLQVKTKNIGVLESLSKTLSFLPDGVRLDSLSFSVADGSQDNVLLMFSGVASDRDALVLFEKTLKESNLFSSIDVPVSSLTKEKDLPFSINISIKNERMDS